jgi:hypothetical protein
LKLVDLRNISHCKKALPFFDALLALRVWHLGSLFVGRVGAQFLLSGRRMPRPYCTSSMPSSVSSLSPTNHALTERKVGLASNRRCSKAAGGVAGRRGLWQLLASRDGLRDQRHLHSESAAYLLIALRLNPMLFSEWTLNKPITTAAIRVSKLATRMVQLPITGRRPSSIHASSKPPRASRFLRIEIRRTKR